MKTEMQITKNLESLKLEIKVKAFKGAKLKSAQEAIGSLERELREARGDLLRSNSFIEKVTTDFISALEYLDGLGEPEQIVTSEFSCLVTSAIMMLKDPDYTNRLKVGKWILDVIYDTAKKRSTGCITKIPRSHLAKEIDYNPSLRKMVVYYFISGMLEIKALRAPLFDSILLQLITVVDPHFTTLDKEVTDVGLNRLNVIKSQCQVTVDTLIRGCDVFEQINVTNEFVVLLNSRIMDALNNHDPIRVDKWVTWKNHVTEINEKLCTEFFKTSI